MGLGKNNSCPAHPPSTAGLYRFAESPINGAGGKNSWERVRRVAVRPPVGDNAMIGPEKPSTLRAKLRQSFKKSDADLLEWFNEQIERAKKKPGDHQVAIESLRLLRDSLLSEVKRPSSRRKPRRLATRPKK